VFGAFFVFTFVAALASLIASAPPLEARSKGSKAQGGPALVQSSARRIPQWVTNIPEEREYLYFVGTSGDAESYDRGKEEAIEDAISQVVKTIGVRVTSTATYEERYFAEQYETTISSELVTEGRAKLQDAEIKEIYFEKYARPGGTSFFRVWALLKYGKKEIAREQERLKSILQAKYGEVSALESKAEEYAAAHRIADAVASRLQAAYTALSIEDGKVLFDRNLNRAQELLLGIRLDKEGEAQVGFVGEALPAPLRIRATFLEGGSRYPVPNLPLLFAYRVPKERSEGYKLLVRGASTGSDGTASYQVDMIEEVSDANRVDVSFDLSAFVKQLQEAPDEYQGGVKALQELLQKKTVTLFFRSDTRARGVKTALFFLQRDVDGKPIEAVAAAPAAYDVLFEKKFAVHVLSVDPRTLAGESDETVLRSLAELAVRGNSGVKRIVYGNIVILEYDTVSGYQSAKAQANAALYDIESDAVVRTWQVQRSGTGSTRELARANALREAGRALGGLLATTMP
jgi:phage gpG-like protein